MNHWIARVVALMVAACALAWGADARAQGGAPPVNAAAWDTVRYAGARGVLVRTAWSAPGARRTADVAVGWVGDGDGASGAPGAVYRGAPALAAVAAREDAALVVLYNGGATPFVRFATFAPGGAGGGRAARFTDVPRAAGAGYRPSAVLACADGEGFTILWQELPGVTRASAGQGREARTYLARVGADGAWIARPRAVSVPWSIAAIAWNGRGYHLALFYDGAGPGRTRLALVTLSPDGRPEQHPWWASPADAIDDVQLAPVPGGVVAVYRGGAAADELREVRAIGVGQWGQEPPPARSLGAISAGQAYALRVDAGGTVSVVRRP